jgi:hypothetical protein
LTNSVGTGQFVDHLWWYGVYVQEDARERFGWCFRYFFTPSTMNTQCQIGNSLLDQAGSEKVAALVEKAKKNNIKIVFPVDYIIADKFDKDAKVRKVTLAITDMKTEIRM